MNKYRVLFAACLAVPGAVFAADADWSNTDKALTLDALKSQIVGNSWSGELDGVKFKEYVDPNGELRGDSEKDGKYTAHWKLREDGLFCFDYDPPGMNAPTDGCVQLIVKGGEVALRLLNGTVEGKFKFEKGNAFKL